MRVAAVTNEAVNHRRVERIWQREGLGTPTNLVALSRRGASHCLTGIDPTHGDLSADDWTTLIDAVESKGLVFHTVIFVGLHDHALFGYQRNSEDETNTFFVALSRARERVYFTRSDERGQTAVIRELIAMLERANVPAFNFE